MNKVIHYRLTQSELRQKFQSSGNFAVAAACGNGEPIRLYNAGTRNKNKVTCEPCKLNRY